MILAIPQSHFQHLSDIFAIPGFLQDPILIFGYQEIRERPSADANDTARLPAQDVPECFRCGELSECLGKLGFPHATVLDQFDVRASLRFDMNQPVPASQHNRYGTFIDIGCLEHVFDTRRCIENYMCVLRKGGHILVHTCVNGYFAHGLHVFNPEALIDAFRINGFDIGFIRFTTPDGVILETAKGHQDVLMWLVAKKTKTIAQFTSPVQYWSEYFDANAREEQEAIQSAYWQRIENLRSDIVE